MTQQKKWVAAAVLVVYLTVIRVAAVELEMIVKLLERRVVRLKFFILLPTLYLQQLTPFFPYVSFALMISAVRHW